MLKHLYAACASLLFPLLVVTSWAGTQAITNVRITGVTSTQAVISYTAPDLFSCSINVSENSNYLPLVHDVDPALFANASSDSRTGNIVNRTQRTFVIGKRAAEMGLDGKVYSRALQTNTVHNFLIKCSTGGSVTYAGQFQTQNLPFGNTFADPQPVDRNKPGQYAWPTLSYSDRSEQIVDPFTGALIRRVSLPQDRVVTQNGQPFAMARSTTWKNPNAALSTSIGSSGATIQGNNTANLLLLPQNNSYFGYISFFKGLHTNNTTTLNWFQSILGASTSNFNCNTSVTDDCKIVACLTVDGVNCYAGGTQIEQALTTTPSTYTFGTSGTAVDLWQPTGVKPPDGTQVATRIGTVVCDGSANVTFISGDFFGTHWSAGSTITINNIDYSIASVNNINTLTLTSSCPSTGGLNVPYQGTNFGVLVRKKTSSNDTVTVLSSQVNYQTGSFPFWSYSGDFDLCGQAPVVGPTGNPGYNCSLYNGGPIFWIDGTTGESHLIARNLGYGCGYFDSIVFDTVNADVFYCGGNNPVSMRYFGNHSEPTNTQTPGHFEEAENLPACNSGTSPTNEPCLWATPLTGSTTMAALTTAFDPTFQADRFLTFYFVGIENKVMVFRNWRGPYTSMGWTIIFDPHATSNTMAGNAGCVGGGQPGCVIAAVPSWSRPGARWCAQKGNDPMYQPGWFAIGSYPWGADTDTRPGVGPYLSNVVDGTAFSNVVDAPGGPTTCPANSLGVVGKVCTTVTMSGEPFDPSPCTSSIANCGGALETGLPGELMSTQVGDSFTLGAPAATEEIMRLVAKSGSFWTFERGYGGTTLSSPANPKIYTFCNANPDPARQSTASGEWYWNYTTDPHGYNASWTTLLGDYQSINAHGFTQSSDLLSGYTTDPRCISGFGYDCYESRLFTSVPALMHTPATNVMQLNPFFAGKYSVADGNSVQTHAAGAGLSATAAQAQYFLDGRPFNGGQISGSQNGNGTFPGTLVSGQLYKFNVFQVPHFDRKYLPSFAFSGSKPLLDISSPAQGNVLGTTSSDAYKYCVAQVVNECRSGSSPFDVYVNAPFVTRPYCYQPGQSTGMPDEYDICIGNNPMVYNSIMQIGDNWVDNTGQYQRVITKALGRNRYLDPFWHVHALANANWFIVKTNYAGDFSDAVFAVKVPPAPFQDSVVRTNFIPLIANVPKLTSATAATATVEFGYAENGDVNNYFCTSRAESCAVGNATSSNTINAQSPFYFQTTEAFLLTGTPCTNGCQIAVPGISQRTLYGRVIYRNSSNAIVGTGQQFVVAIP